MYYLTIKNLGVEKCIDRNIEDIYEEGQQYSYIPSFFYVKNRIVKVIMISCTEMSGARIIATVYSD